MEITEPEFHQLVDYVKTNYGLNLCEKRVLIMGRLSNYIVKQGFHSFSDLLEHVITNPKGEEAISLVNCLTTNHTYFMREPVHFNFLRQRVLPELKIQERISRDIRIWSAASSSGEEAYSIAMLLQDFFQLESNQWDTTVLATDISTKALAKAKDAVYTEEQMEHLPEVWIRRYFTKKSDGYHMNDDLRRQVVFRYFNLMEEFPFRRKFHVVFLRNVMIYFDEPTKQQLLDRVYDSMEDGSYLFIGTTETLDRSKSKLTYIQPSIYRKTGGITSHETD